MVGWDIRTHDEIREVMSEEDNWKRKTYHG